MGSRWHELYCYQQEILLQMACSYDFDRVNIREWGCHAEKPMFWFQCCTVNTVKTFYLNVSNWKSIVSHNRK